MSDMKHRLKKLEQQTGDGLSPLPTMLFVSVSFQPEGDREAIIDKIIADYELTHPKQPCYSVNSKGEVVDPGPMLARLNGTPKE